MGAGCCRGDPELNPDGTDKGAQTGEQVSNDPIDARKAAKDGDTDALSDLLRRMRKKQINSGASPKEALPEDTGNTALHFVAAQNHLRGVRKLLWFNASPNVKNKIGRTPLHLALAGGKQKVAAYLLDHGADPNIKDKTGISVVLAAAKAGRRGIVRFLMDKAPATLDVAVFDKQGNTLFTICAKYGWHDLLADLIPRLPAQLAAKLLSRRSLEGDTALGWVLKFGSAVNAGAVTGAGASAEGAPGSLAEPQLLELVKQLLDAGALATTPCCLEKVHPISLAAATGSMAVIRLLLAKRAKYSVKDALNRTPLHYAAAKGWEDVTAELLAQGLSPTAADSQKNTPLHLAASRGQQAVLKLLMEKVKESSKKPTDLVAALLATNKAGMSVYHMSLMGGHTDTAQKTALDVLEQVGDAGVSAAVTDKRKKDTPLLLAIGSHQDQVVKVLLAKGASVNSANKQGELPIARNLASVKAATAEQDAAILGMLLDAGASLEGASAAQHPLLAICKNSLSNFAEKALVVLKAHLPEGAKLDWNKQDDQGRSPLALAALHDNVYMVRYLVDEEKQPVDARDKAGLTALMSAARGGSSHTMKVLLNRRADPVAKDNAGHSAMWHCLLLDKVETLTCAAMLLMMGAQAERGCFDITGESLLHRAVRYGAEGFIGVWSKFGGDLKERCSLPPTADDMPGAEVKEVEVEDYLDKIAEANEVEDEEEDAAGEAEEELDADEEAMEKQAQGAAAASGGAAVAEGVEDAGVEEEMPDDDEEEMGMQAQGTASSMGAAAVAEGVEDNRDADQEAFDDDFVQPSDRQLRKLEHRGVAWWGDFWSNTQSHVPPPDDGLYDLEDDHADDNDGDTLDVEDLLIYHQDQARRANKARRISRALRLGGPVAEATLAHPELDGDGLMADLELYMQDPIQWQMQGMPRLTAAGPVSESLDTRTKGDQNKSKTGKNKKAKKEEDEEEDDGGDDEDDDGEGGDLGGFLVQDASDEEDDDEDAPSRKKQGNKSGKKDAPGDGQRNGEEEEQGADLCLVIGAGNQLSKVKSKVDRSRASSFVAGAQRSSQSSTLMGGLASKSAANLGASAGPDPYFQTNVEGQCVYNGQPAYMNQDKHWTHEREELHNYALQLEKRLSAYKEGGKDDKALVGPDLRERNIVWWNSSLPPTEFFLKPGQWKAAAKKAPAAMKGARDRRPAKVGTKVQERKKTAWFGVPDLPTRPELLGTTALVYAVRLGRMPCVRALLDASLMAVNVPDGNGYTPLCFAMYMLVNDRHNVAIQQMVDLLLAALPQVNLNTPILMPKRTDTPIRGKKPPKRDQAFDLAHNVMDPVICAALLGDAPRLTHMVLHCRGSLDMPQVHMPAISAYFKALFDKLVVGTNSMIRPLHIAILHKKLEFVRLVIDLGADLDLFAEPPDSAKLQAKLIKQQADDAKYRAKAMKGFNPLKVAEAGLFHRFSLMKRWLCNIEIPGLTKPHPWLSPMHLAGRLGLAEVCQLLVTRGAQPSGGPVCAFARKSPLEEALGYARKNHQKANTGAARSNWKSFSSVITAEAPPMNKKCAAMAAGEALSNMGDYMSVTGLAMKAAALAARITMNIILAMMKRPISHVDPALQAAHVLLLARAPVDLTNTQTSILFRDLLDNDHQWGWVGMTVPLAQNGPALLNNPRFIKAVGNLAATEYQTQWQGYQDKLQFYTAWPADGLVQVHQLLNDNFVGTKSVAGTNKPEDYRKKHKAYMSRATNFYFTTGVKVLHKLYQARCRKSRDQEAIIRRNQERAQKDTVERLVGHAKAANELLGSRAAARGAAAKAAAAQLAPGWAFEEDEAPESCVQIKGLDAEAGDASTPVVAIGRRSAGAVGSTSRRASKVAPNLATLFKVPDMRPADAAATPAAAAMQARAAELCTKLSAAEGSFDRFCNEVDVALVLEGRPEVCYQQPSGPSKLVITDPLPEAALAAPSFENIATVTRAQRMKGQDPKASLAGLVELSEEDAEEQLEELMASLQELQDGLATLLELCGIDDILS